MVAVYKGERQLLGRFGVLLPPEGEESLGVDSADGAQTVDAGMTAPAEGYEPGWPGKAGTAVVDYERAGLAPGISTDSAEASIACEHRSPVAGKVSAIMLLAGIAGRAQPEGQDPGGPAAAP